VSFSISKLDKVVLRMRKFFPGLSSINSLTRTLSERGFSRSTVNKGTPQAAITFTKDGEKLRGGCLSVSVV
jgi:hypothetical protein